jgi:hypothetical protein
MTFYGTVIVNSLYKYIADKLVFSQTRYVNAERLMSMADYFLHRKLGDVHLPSKFNSNVYIPTKFNSNCCVIASQR